MDRTCIAIVDATRARLFTFDRESDAGGVHEDLEEREDLVNPQRRQRPSELFSDSRPGSSRTGGLGYAFDDRRSHHMDEIDAVFARDVAHKIEDLVRAAPTRRLIVCASPNMLGALRATDLRRMGIVIDELDRDLVKLTPAQLRDYLTSVDLLPEPPARPELRP